MAFKLLAAKQKGPCGMYLLNQRVIGFGAFLFSNLINASFLIIHILHGIQLFNLTIYCYCYNILCVCASSLHRWIGGISLGEL